tara:strand:+ start:1895 stop:3676 length:1782 start_codon:yes stop_codon:yes gene_type:complete
MSGVNGQTSWGFQPVGYGIDNLTPAFPRQESRQNTLKSANDHLRYQVQWVNGSYGSLNEGIEPSKLNYSAGNGDLVNVVFSIYATVKPNEPSLSNWDLIGTIKKSRDIANKRYTTGQPAIGHRFTIDVSQLISDQLSYSLCPINKGTWRSNLYGGMNGGLTMQDNVLNFWSSSGNPISLTNVSNNGTYRYLKVKANFEIINSIGEIQTATGAITSNTTTIINSVNQVSENKTPYFNSYNISNSEANKYSLLTRCPNSTNGFKKIREEEQAEFLQFYVHRADSTNIAGGGSPSDYVSAMALMIETIGGDGSVQDTFYLRDFEDNLLSGVSTGGLTYILNEQKQMCIQNISPYYINNSGNVWKARETTRTVGGFPYWDAYTGDKILSTTESYRVSLVKISLYGSLPQTVRRVSKYYFYDIDRESDSLAYGFVRFHWLNSMGGIDSYTAKRDIMEGLNISRDVVDRKSADRTWYQNVHAGDNYKSDTMRGGNLYKGGREVSSVNADKVLSVYTEPLNKSNAEWLQEILLSPNVWIEKDTEATAEGNTVNPYLRPSTKGYIPVIITNSDIETVNQAEGLVKFNIEYTLSHKVKTQSN